MTYKYDVVWPALRVYTCETGCVAVASLALPAHFTSRRWGGTSVTGQLEEHTLDTCSTETDRNILYLPTLLIMHSQMHYVRLKGDDLSHNLRHHLGLQAQQ